MFLLTVEGVYGASSGILTPPSLQRVHACDARERIMHHSLCKLFAVLPPTDLLIQAELPADVDENEAEENALMCSLEGPVYAP